MAFADSAVVNNWSDWPNSYVEENYNLDPPSALNRTVHFRHQDVANAVFVDGHVEAVSATVNPIPGYAWWISNDVQILQAKQHIYDFGETDRWFIPYE